MQRMQDAEIQRLFDLKYGYDCIFLSKHERKGVKYRNVIKQEKCLPTPKN